MKNLAALLEGEQARRGDFLTEAQYLETLEGLAPIFREQGLRDAVPTTIINDPGILKSRHLNVVDIAEAEAGMRGTGGTYDRADAAQVEVDALAIWKNIEMRWRDKLTASRGGFDLFMESARLATERVVEKENTLLTVGIGAVKGITNASGIQTFASAGAWTTDKIAAQDISKALFGKLANENIPVENAAMLLHPLDAANLYAHFSEENNARIGVVRSMLPGGIRTSKNVTEGKAYVYARTPTALEYRVYQDLSVIELPQTDEDERLRVRTIGALHVKRPKAVVEITSINV